MINSQINLESIAGLSKKVEDLLKFKSTNSEMAIPMNLTSEFIEQLESFQAELRMLNIKSSTSQLRVLNSIDLYEYAPHGYFIISNTGEIIGSNLSGANLLKSNKSELLGKKFVSFLKEESKLVFTIFIKKLQQKTIKQQCEVILTVNGMSNLYAFVSGFFDINNQQFLLTVIDITEQKKMNLL